MISFNNKIGVYRLRHKIDSKIKNAVINTTWHGVMVKTYFNLTEEMLPKVWYKIYTKIFY